jgi:hypothetical protein
VNTSTKSGLLLGNCSVNGFPLKPFLCKDEIKNTSITIKELLGRGVFCWGRPETIQRELRESFESAVGRIIEKRWQRDGWQLQQRNGLRVRKEIAGRTSCTRIGEGRS